MHDDSLRRHSQRDAGDRIRVTDNHTGASAAIPSTSRELVAYEDAPLGVFHLRVAVASIGGVFTDGYGLGIIGISLNLATPRLALTPLWLGLLGGASLAGLFLGALLAGAAADRFGRRPIFAYNMGVLAAFSLLQYEVASGAQLLALRLVIGFILGTDYAVSKSLLAEFTPRAYRGRMLSLLSVAWAGGYTSAYFAAFELLSLGPEAWRWMLLSSAAPCLLILPFRITMPESPLWLAAHGHADCAVQVVRQTVGSRVTPPPLSSPIARRQGRWRQLFSKTWRRRTFVACTFFTCQVIPYFAIGTFVARVLAALNVQGGYAGGRIYNVSLLVGAVLGIVVVDKISRRSFLIGSFILSASAMLILCVWTSIPSIAIVLLFAVFAGVISAASNLVHVYLPELFPTDLRASGIGLAIAASRFGSAISTFLLPIVVAHFGARTALSACVLVLALAAIVCQRWAPETRNTLLGTLKPQSD
jgi:MFS transporter, putative metabolite transport protein